MFSHSNLHYQNVIYFHKLHHLVWSDVWNLTVNILLFQSFVTANRSIKSVSNISRLSPQPTGVAVMGSKLATEWSAV